MSNFNGDVSSLQILQTITDGLDFTIPVVDLDDPIYNIPGGTDAEWYQQVPKLTNAQLTTRVPGGEGAFDNIMASVRAHLREEYDAGRIVGAEYTKAYIALTESALSGSVQFLLQKDAAYWQAVQAQIAAITARVTLQTAKIQLAMTRIDALNSKSQYALTTLKLASEDAQFAVLKEQHEAARAQTLDTRTDGTVVVGSVGMQKKLYQQQITSYQRDSEVKAAKMFADAWITQKTIDEGLLAPTEFQNAAVNQVLEHIRSNNGLD